MSEISDKALVALGSLVTLVGITESQIEAIEREHLSDIGIAKAEAAFKEEFFSAVKVILEVIS